VTFAVQLAESFFAGLAFLYAFGLVFLVFQRVGDARHMLSYWDATLGVPLAERSYAAECAIYTPDDPVSRFRNVHDILFDGEGFFDVFILCHVLGWFCKMLMIRDLRLTLVASVLFEVYELTFQHMLPNFRECWWDSLIVDIVVCNGLGILCGYYWLKFWKCADYNFLGDVDVLSGGRVVKRWKPLVSFKFFLAPLVVLGSLAVSPESLRLLVFLLLFFRRLS
jgi:phosphatidylserine synthase 2